MRTYTNTRKRRVRVDLGQIARASKYLVPESEWTHYDTFCALVEGGRVGDANRLGSARSNPQLWEGCCPIQFKGLYQAYTQFTKLSVKGDLAAEAAAMEKFRWTETMCSRTNMRLARAYYNRSRFYAKFPHLWAFETRLRANISRLMGGELTVERYRKMVQGFRFGPGMTVSSGSSERTTIPFKLSDPVSVTAACHPVWVDVASHVNHPDWFQAESINGCLYGRTRVNVVPGCRLIFVDKNFEEKRTIAAEPSANIVPQLLVHEELAKTLKRGGVDLHDQTPNRRLALIGSQYGTHATIDLKSASDLKALSLVGLFYPKGWATLIQAIRSPVGQYRGETFVLQKMATSGNGSTFALETTFFKALVDTIVAKAHRSDTAVYGDDIVVPTSYFQPLCRALRFFGFVVNQKKSFSEGPFRESCGLDAFGGVDVRPVFLRSDLLDLDQAIDLHNRYIARGMTAHADILERAIPPSCRLYAPIGTRTVALHTQDEAKLASSRYWVEDFQDYFYRHYVVDVKQGRHPIRYRYLANLVSGGSFSNGAPLRNQKRIRVVDWHS